jgi:hypothetical protein
VETKGQTEKALEGHDRDERAVKKAEKVLATARSKEVTSATPKGEKAWSSYADGE